MAAKNRAVFGIYSSQLDAENAVRGLKLAGFRSADISILFPDNMGTKDLALERNTKAPEGTAAGAGGGAVVGGILGWLAGAGLLAIPGLGMFVAAGPIMAVLSGIGVGGVLGGVAGHAGVFSTAEDLARLAHAMLNGGRPIVRPETLALFTPHDESVSEPTGTFRALGWDTPSAPSQSGKYLGSSSFGHLGYTGTSLWIDPVRQLSITLLTNRTWPDCSNQAIKQVRPQFHDAVMEGLDGDESKK